jgi:hypothetical protein
MTVQDPTDDEMEAAEQEAQVAAWEAEREHELAVDGPGGYWDTMWETYKDYHS